MHEDTRSTQALIRMNGVRCQRGGREVLRGLDLEVGAGEVRTLLGPNGAGKSTTVGLILGLLRPSAGHITVLGERPGSLTARQATGVMLQAGAVPVGLRVRELLELARAGYPDPVPVRELADLAGVTELLGRDWHRLSGGQQRRALLAMALAGNPRVLFLDEPTAGLDVPAKRELWATVRALREAGRAVLLATHDMSEAEALSDRVLLIHDGRVLASDSADGLRERIPNRRVRCQTRIDAETLSAWPEVRHCDHKEGRIEVLTPDAESLTKRLLEADPALSELEIHAASLEEAFMQLTHDGDSNHGNAIHGKSNKEAA